MGTGDGDAHVGEGTVTHKLRPQGRVRTQGGGEVVSDESIWGPPTAGPAPVPVPVEPSSPPPHRSRGPIIAVVVGAVALIGAGVFAVSRVVGDDSAGGADSPEAAGLALLDALDQEDALGVIDLLLPGERETLREPLTELVDELTPHRGAQRRRQPRRGSPASTCRSATAASTSKPTNVDDIVNLKISAMATATVDGEALPIGELVLDVAEGEPSELDVAAVRAASARHADHRRPRGRPLVPQRGLHARRGGSRRDGRGHPRDRRGAGRWRHAGGRHGQPARGARGARPDRVSSRRSTRTSSRRSSATRRCS